jgi:hypothetical protein
MLSLSRHGVLVDDGRGGGTATVPVGRGAGVGAEAGVIVERSWRE